MRHSSTVLGLDLGSTSVGWSLVDKNHGTILGIGARIFDPGVDSAEQFARGGEESKAKARRDARQQRRMTKRRAQRLKTTYSLLAEAQLLPPITGSGPESVQRNEVLKQLDLELSRKRPSSDSADAHLLCYRLRTLALDERLQPYELGRALYHLAQRRGFRSNRLEKSKKKDEDEGKVKAGISELEAAIKKAGARTLGEYFAGLDPCQQRIRRRWTSRESMYEPEFAAICDAQARFGDQRFSGELRRKLHHAIFYQRPLRSSKHLIGKCELEPKAQRAPKATLIAQEFRLLQTVNDLRIIGNEEERPLSDEQRKAVINALQDHGDQKFPKVKQLLGLPKEAELNAERKGEKGIRGNRVRAAMLSAFGKPWDDLAPEQQDAFVEEWRTLESPSQASFLRRATNVFGLSTEAAEQLAQKAPESGYLNLSRKALRKLLPLMRQGAAYAEAVKQAYGSRLTGGKEYPFLPPFNQKFSSIRNPAVERAMSELRKVVNAVVRRYGKPDAIRIELARDLKRNRKQRQKIAADMREREKQRSDMQSRILRECGLEARGRDIEKALLWAECGGVCPYTGRSIEFGVLFSGAQVEIEHIIPASYFPDDSFVNKTLCWQDFNRIKGNRTPREALGSTPEFEEILERVRHFKGNAKLEKLRRFQLDVRNAEEFYDFTQRRLSDTRYISKLAADYIGLLYGGRDQDGARKVFASSGVVTATLRRRWGLEAILREPDPASNAPQPGKSRSDHRHHAIDALVVALTSEAAVQRLAAAAGVEVQQRGVMRISAVEGPWPNFVPSIRQAVEKLIVSHRVDHRLNGPLHNETNYAEHEMPVGKTKVHVRKPLSGISAKEVQSIVDKAVRKAVEKKLEELGGDIKKLQAACDPGLASYDPPFLRAKDGRRIPIVRVRIALNLSPVPIGEDDFRRRFVAPAGNHHIAFFEVTGKKGKREWDAVIRTRLDAVRDQNKDRPVVDKKLQGENDAEFLFALMGGDLIEMDDQGRRAVFVTRKISENDLIFVRHHDARKIKNLDETRVRLRSYEKFRKLNPRKVQVSPLGEIYPAND